VLAEAVAFAERKLAFYLMDPPGDSVADQAAGASWIGNYPASVPQSQNAALYFPYIQSADPTTGVAVNLPPSGSVAGIFARTDSTRGVWKAPAGIETTIVNTTGVVPANVLTDQQHGVLNNLGIDCLRTLPGVGTVVFGARTIIYPNTALRTQWGYVPVRRMALFIEQTLKSNLTWVIFEPNDEPLWVAIRTTIEGFMLSLFNQGAFAGSKPSEAFQVKCDSSTTTPDDVNNGIVNIVVAFAPLKPAEFVIIKIAQRAGQAQA
jgi:phage tail sheath protein FI